MGYHGLFLPYELLQDSSIREELLGPIGPTYTHDVVSFVTRVFRFFK